MNIVQDNITELSSCMIVQGGDPHVNVKHGRITDFDNIGRAVQGYCHILCGAG